MNSQKTMYREPGEDAIDFANSFIGNRTMEQSRLIIEKLMKGELHDPTDKRIKRCDYCGYFWRDSSLKNNKRKCSDDCERKLKTMQRAEQRARKELLNPTPKPRDLKKEMYTYYADHLEYPYYLSEHYMLKRAHRYETPCSPSKLAQIDGAIQRGYKRKSKSTPTDGSDKVHIRGLGHKHSYGEVTVSQLEPGYFERKYSERHLKLERWRARNFKLATK